MKFKIEKKITKKGFPTSSKGYKNAHEQADREEKKKFPKGYEKLKKLDEKLPKRELIGKNTKSGKIEVNKIVPKNLRQEVAFHEKMESKQLKKLRKK